jgi:hypothetical protein
MIGSMGDEFGPRSSAAIRWHNSIAYNTTAGVNCDTCLR